VRYARALFDVAVKEGIDLSKVDDEVASFAGLLRDHPTLEKVLLNPAVPAPRKRAAVAEITRRTGVLPVVGKLLLLLAERDRLAILPGLLEAYRHRLMDHRQVVRAEITTAAPLAAPRTRAIEESLARLTGRTVNLSTRVDPALIGGLVARVEGTVYDGSLAMQLEKMRQRFVEKA
jgi:F-type H+-transporting ATPase subunit delta